MKLLFTAIQKNKFLGFIVLFFIVISSGLIFIQSLAIANVINIGISISPAEKEQISTNSINKKKENNLEKNILNSQNKKNEEGKNKKNKKNGKNEKNIFQKSKQFFSLFLKDRKKASEYLIDQNSFFLLGVIGIFFMAVMFLVQLFHFLRSFYIDYFVVKIVAEIRKIIFRHLLHLPVSFYQKNTQSTLSSKIINDTYYLQNYFYDFIEAVLLGPIVACLALILLLSINVQFSLLILISFLIFSFAINFLFRKLKSIVNQMQQKIGNLSHIILQALNNIKIVKIYGGEKTETKKFNDKVQDYIKDVKKERIFFRLSTPLIEFFGILLLLAIFGYGTMMIWRGKMTVENILEFLIIFLFISPYVQRISKIFALRQQIQSILERVEEILKEQIEEIKNSKKNVKVNFQKKFYQEKFFFEKSLSLKGIFYHYPKQDFIQDEKDQKEKNSVSKKKEGIQIIQQNHQLKNIYLKIYPKQFIAIVGESGSGKSTLIQILANLLEPTQGKIFYDNIEISKIHKKQIRKNIAYIGQYPEIFNDSIENNLCYGKSYSKQEMIHACQLADIHDFIQTKKEKYKLVIGEGKTQLSGGQLQRLCIARAILKQAKIILLDEPTSSLDHFSEEKVNETILHLRQRAAIILSTHKLKIVEQADCIYFLEKGEVVSFGTHQELLQKNDSYRKLVEVKT